MKMILVVVDAARVDDMLATVDRLGAPGYTVLPVIAGEGRGGVRSGDRVHPGATAAVFIVAADADAGRLFDAMMAERARVGDTVSRLFLLPVERSA